MGHVAVMIVREAGSQRTLVTGAAGFLGSWVGRSLASRAATVVGLDLAWDRSPAADRPDGVAQVDGDVRDRDLVARLLADERIDTVIHLAAQTLVGPAVEDPVDTFSHNVEGTWSVLEACRQSPAVRAVVVASSDKAYGDAGGRSYREEMPLRPRHPYDASKAAADLISQAYASTYGLPVAISRCANLYGGGDGNWSRVVPGTIRSVLAGERPVIRSDGTLVRDYLYVEDAASAVVCLADHLAERPAEFRGEAFNFSAGVRLPVRALVDRILRVMRSDLEPIVEGRDLPEIPEQRVSAAKARRELGWRAVTRLDAGLRRSVDWYRDHLGRAG